MIRLNKTRTIRTKTAIIIAIEKESLIPNRSDIFLMKFLIVFYPFNCGKYETIIFKNPLKWFEL